MRGCVKKANRKAKVCFGRNDLPTKESSRMGLSMEKEYSNTKTVQNT